MISKVASLSQNITKIAQNKEFNNTLPVLLKILSKEGGDLYSIKIGNLTQQTKSLKELQIGARYFANISKSSVGTTLISNLTPYPEHLSNLISSPLRFKHNELKALLESKDFGKDYKDFLTQQFVQANNKNDFFFYGNMLLALQKNIYNFIVDENGRNKILQIKAKNTSSHLEFYALFPALGNISGMVYYDKDAQMGLNLNTHFKSVKSLLERNLDSLHGFKQINISVQENIPPLFTLEDHLLNITG